MVLYSWPLGSDKRNLPSRANLPQTLRQILPNRLLNKSRCRREFRFWFSVASILAWVLGLRSGLWPLAGWFRVRPGSSLGHSEQFGQVDQVVGGDEAAGVMRLVGGQSDAALDGLAGPASRSLVPVASANVASTENGPPTPAP